MSTEDLYSLFNMAGHCMITDVLITRQFEACSTTSEQLPFFCYCYVNGLVMMAAKQTLSVECLLSFLIARELITFVVRFGAHAIKVLTRLYCVKLFYMPSMPVKRLALAPPGNFHVRVLLTELVRMFVCKKFPLLFVYNVIKSPISFNAIPDNLFKNDERLCSAVVS